MHLERDEPGFHLERSQGSIGEPGLTSFYALREDHCIDQPEFIGDPCAGQGREAADDHGSEQDATQLVISQAIGGLK